MCTSVEKILGHFWNDFRWHRLQRCRHKSCYHQLRLRTLLVYDLLLPSVACRWETKKLVIRPLPMIISEDYLSSAKRWVDSSQTQRIRPLFESSLAWKIQMLNHSSNSTHLERARIWTMSCYDCYNHWKIFNSCLCWYFWLTSMSWPSNSWLTEVRRPEYCSLTIVSWSARCSQ